MPRQICSEPISCGLAPLAPETCLNPVRIHHPSFRLQLMDSSHFLKEAQCRILLVTDARAHSASRKAAGCRTGTGHPLNTGDARFTIGAFPGGNCAVGRPGSAAEASAMLIREEQLRTRQEREITEHRQKAAALPTARSPTSRLRLRPLSTRSSLSQQKPIAGKTTNSRAWSALRLRKRCWPGHALRLRALPGPLRRPGERVTQRQQEFKAQLEALAAEREELRPAHRSERRPALTGLQKRGARTGKI